MLTKINLVAEWFGKSMLRLVCTPRGSNHNRIERGWGWSEMRHFGRIYLRTSIAILATSMAWMLLLKETFHELTTTSNYTVAILKLGDCSAGNCRSKYCTLLFVYINEIKLFKVFIEDKKCIYIPMINIYYLWIHLFLMGLNRCYFTRLGWRWQDSKAVCQHSCPGDKKWTNTYSMLGDLKASFSIATSPRCRGGCYSFPRIASLTLDPYLMLC